MSDREERSERIREEVDPTSDDPLIEEVDPAANQGMLVGKVDDVGRRLADRYTADSEPHVHQGTDVAAQRASLARESSRGETFDLDADAERRLGRGDELVVRLPLDGAGHGWSYDIEGDERAVGVFERAELVTHGAPGGRAPASGGCFQFVIHATARGRATVRFERLGAADAPADRLRLRLEVR